jgi:hypothetical protein
MSPTLPRDRYPSLAELDAFFDALCAAHPGWVTRCSIGQSLEGRPLWLLTLGAPGPDREHRPAFWLDAGTHCAEWAGIAAAADALGRWGTELAAGGPLRDWLQHHTLHVVPCISPDGYAAMLAGAPYTRSTLRPPTEGTVRTGWSPEDMDGDGVVRLMRWRHPAGSFVVDAEEPLHMRFRTVDDRPEDAYFVAEEGRFVEWDGVRWTGAPREHGLDLNRNFPGSWRPFSMFGMDAGAYPTSAPESRAVVEALAARPSVAAALTLHTFTGCILTAPYRADSPLGGADVAVLQRLAADSVAGTSYRAIAVHPDFTYDAKNPIGGVWSDTLTTVFGVAAYTLEIWDPFAAAGVETASVARFFRDPEPEVLQGLVRHFGNCPGTLNWTPFSHPQLGEVEVGGIDLQRTVRNPPEQRLPEELDTVFQIVERARKSLPRLTCTAALRRHGPSGGELEVVVENVGFLGSAGLERAAQVGRVPGIRVTVEGPEGTLLTRNLGQVDGWGQTRAGAGAMPLMPGLPARGHRAVLRLAVEGPGPWTVRWHSTRGGRGEVVVPG